MNMIRVFSAPFDSTAHLMGGLGLWWRSSLRAVMICV